MSTLELLRSCRVLPVVTAHDVASTVTLTQALQEGGMKAVEVTLRTPAALDAIRDIKRSVSGMLVAAGTVTNAKDMAAAVAAGADFLVSPGISSELLETARQLQVPFIPGVATPSDVMLGLNVGLDCFKLFPAEAIGGRALLKAMSGPFPAVHFCPTGGLNPDNFRAYLELGNVACVGGSWMVADTLVRAGDWDRVRALAADAMQPSLS